MPAETVPTQAERLAIVTRHTEEFFAYVNAVINHVNPPYGGIAAGSAKRYPKP